MNFTWCWQPNRCVDVSLLRQLERWCTLRFEHREWHHLEVDYVTLALGLFLLVVTLKCLCSPCLRP